MIQRLFTNIQFLRHIIVKIFEVGYPTGRKLPMGWSRFEPVFHPSSLVVTPVLWIFLGWFFQHLSNLLLKAFSDGAVTTHPMEGCSRVPQFYLRKSVFSGLDLRSFSWITRNHGLAGSHLLTATTAWCAHLVISWIAPSKLKVWDVSCKLTEGPQQAHSVSPSCEFAVMNE